MILSFKNECVSSRATSLLVYSSPGGAGGGYFGNFWVRMWRWDPGTLNPELVQLNFATLYYSKLPKSP